MNNKTEFDSLEFEGWVRNVPHTVHGMSLADAFLDEVFIPIVGPASFTMMVIVILIRVA